MSYIPDDLQDVWSELNIKDKQFVIRSGIKVLNESSRMGGDKMTIRLKREHEREMRRLEETLQQKDDYIGSFNQKERQLKQKFSIDLQQQEDTFRRERIQWRERERELQDKIRQVEASTIDIALSKVKTHMSDVGSQYTAQIDSLKSELRRWQGMYDDKHRETQKLMDDLKEQSMYKVEYSKSQRKGAVGENEAMAVLSESFHLKGYNIIDTSKEGGVGDIRVVSQDGSSQCMVEVKNYDSRAIPTKEVQKCERDVSQTKEIDCSVFISLGSPITGHKHEDIGWVCDSDGKSKPILFLTSRDELQRLGEWVYLLMHLTKNAHECLVKDIENKKDMISMKDYVYYLKTMMDQIHPLKKVVSQMKSNLLKQVEPLETMITKIIVDHAKKLEDTGIVMYSRDQNVLVSQKKMDVEMQDWLQQYKDKSFLWKNLSAYLKDIKGVKGKRIYNLRDKYCIKVESKDEIYETNIPPGCKRGEAYYVLKQI